MAIGEAAVQLYHEYMNIEVLTRYQDHTLITDLEAIRGIDKDDIAFVFLSYDNNEGQTNALLLSHTQMRGMLQRGAEWNEWSEVYFVRENESRDNADVEAIYAQFPLFNHFYQYQKADATFPRLLSLINLNFTNPTKQPSTSARNYTPLFLAAADLKESTIKLTSDEDQIALGEIFKPFLQTDRKGKLNLTDAHFEQVSAVYSLPGKSLTIQAQTLLCLAAVFVNYSSTYHFGKEDESPNALRNYAIAFLHRANQLDPNVFVDANGVHQLENWIGRLAGTGQSFTCTAILKGVIERHAKAGGFGHILGEIKPPAW